MALLTVDQIKDLFYEKDGTLYNTQAEASKAYLDGREKYFGLV